MSSPDDLVTATKNEVIAINNIGQIIKNLSSSSSSSVTITKNSNFTLDQNFIKNAIIVGDSSGSPWTITIPSEASMLTATGWVIPIGVHIDVVQYNTVQITIAAAGGVALHTARSLTTRARYSVITLTKIGVDDWIVSGDTT